MDANQLMEGIGAAVAAAKPAQEHCFLGSGWSFMCWPLPDWYGGLGLIVSALAAAGTVAAVVVALRLARRTDGQREAREARLQRMHALHLLPVLEGFHSDLRHSYTWVFFADEEPKSMDDVSERLSRANKWATAFEKHSALGPLAAESLLLLPEMVGFRISRALGELHALRIEISRFTPDEWHDPVRTIASKAMEWAGTQSHACDLISVAIQDLEALADPKAIYPSGEELHGDPGVDW
ncbi:MAG: hypothetical protein RR100_10385 [Comamonas sp.]